MEPGETAVSRLWDEMQRRGKNGRGSSARGGEQCEIEDENGGAAGDVGGGED
jgi:hypothetical protein